jgi:diphthine synthase
MPELVFIGLGLYDEKDISQKGLEIAKECDILFAEFYTSKLSEGSLNKLQEIIGKEVTVLNREEFEAGKVILEKAKESKVGILIVGDPMTATTHVSLRLDAEREGIITRIVHGASIFTATSGLLGLQSYKFGRVTTLGFPRENFLPRSPYQVIEDNLAHNLHTLILLDIDAENNRYMSAREALNLLLELEELEGGEVISEDMLLAVVGNAGSDDPAVSAGYLKDLLEEEFPEGLYSLVIPSELHYMEAEALVELAGASRDIIKE